MKSHIKSEVIIESMNIIGNNIIESKLGSIILAANRQVINDNAGFDKNVYFLKSGEVEVHKKIDDIIITNINHPSVIGLTGITSSQSYHYICCVGDTTLISVEKQEMLELIEERKLWKEVAIALCYAAQLYYGRDEMISSSNVYGIVRNHLLYINNLPEYRRKEVSVYDYILKRNNISRSSLNKIIKDLMQGGYIEMNRGKLAKINKLPESY